MTPPTTARTRIKDWIKVYATSGTNFVNDRLSCSLLKAPLYLSDVQSLVEAFDKPCGSCHPCTNYADETWRAAGRKPPHVYQWDEAQQRLQKLRDLVSYCRAQADDRENVDGERSAYDDTATKLAEILAEPS
jgi:hypothetical protein